MDLLGDVVFGVHVLLCLGVRGLEPTWVFFWGLLLQLFCFLSAESFEARGSLWRLVCMFNICSWNVRGLNDPSKRDMVRHVISSLRNVVVCLKESKVRHVSCSFLKSFAGSFLDKRQIIEANGASGGLITCWSSKIFDCTEVLMRTFSITVHLLHRASGERFFVTNVYGPHSGEGKDSFCAELAQLKICCKGTWVLCGDFNLTRARDERNGGRGGGGAARKFNDLISELELIDLPMQNQ